MGSESVVPSRWELDVMIRELRLRILAGGPGVRMRSVRSRLASLIQDRVSRFGQPTLYRGNLNVPVGLTVEEVLRSGPEQYRVLLNGVQIGKIEVGRARMTVYCPDHNGHKLPEMGIAGGCFLTDDERTWALNLAVGKVLSYRTRTVEKIAARVAGSLPDDAA